MTELAQRLKDVLWSIRSRFGFQADIDRVLPFVVFDQKLSEDQLEMLFVSRPKWISEAFEPAILAEIQRLIRNYWQYLQTHKGYHKILKSLKLLEGISRVGFGRCCLVPDKTVGFRIELK